MATQRTKLPNGNAAIVDLAKLGDYCLDPFHPRGRHKAPVFAASLGIRKPDAEWLREQLIDAACNHEAESIGADEFGERYRIDLWLEHNARRAQVRSFWIIRAGETIPRLTTCYVL